MSSFVALQMSLLTKGLIAEATAERPYVLVHSHVDHQVVRLGEGFATDFAIFEDPITGLVITYMLYREKWEDILKSA